MTDDISGLWNGEGNINEDPEFADTLFHISLESPCFNTGTDLIEIDGVTYNCPDMDFEGEPRPLYGAADIGADEVFIEGMPDHLNPSTSNLDLKNYPNPFSTSTTIEYELQQHSTVQITIYNHLGEQIELISEKYQPMGKHQFTWHAENQPAGVYYCTLRTVSRMQTAKMIKMK